MGWGGKKRVVFIHNSQQLFASNETMKRNDTIKLSRTCDGEVSFAIKICSCSMVCFLLLLCFV